MQIFFTILNQITLPILFLIGTGYILQRFLKLDVPSLNHIVVYGLLPIFIIHTFSQASFSTDIFIMIILITVLQFMVLSTIGWLMAALLRLPRDIWILMGLIMAVPNSGNYSIPLMELAFGEQAISYQAIIVSVHNTLLLSIGVLLLSGEGKSFFRAFGKSFKTPFIPALILGFLLNRFDISLPFFLHHSFELIGNAYLPMALFGLGGQLAITNWHFSLKIHSTALSLRLIAAPIVTTILVFLCGAAPSLKEVFILGAGAPSAVLLAILAAEYQRRTAEVTSIVFLSTILSPIAVSILLLFL